MSHGSHLDWVTTEKLSELSGYPEGSLNKLKERGRVAYGIHWKHNPINRIIWNVEAFEKWQENGMQVLSQDQQAA